MTSKPFNELNFVNRFQQLPDALYSPVEPQGLLNPKLVCASSSAATLLDLDLSSLETPDILNALSGNALHHSWRPIAMKYTGHQFGYYNPDLGDGRGLLVAEVENDEGEIWDLHLKGAGLTPYSRQGDGRAVLRSSIREFLCSEAMAALGIPTTRALCVIDSDTPVYREKPESGATILRLASTHIRFGHFEFCSFTQQYDLLKALADYVIDQHYPELNDSDQPYLEFFKVTLNKTAELMAHWQSVGFAHGVMNTDNMSILGDTFDYGPFAFLDDCEPGFICNHSDHQGRYAFNQQPNIANWNLAVLAQALLPLVDKQSLVSELENYADIFRKHFVEKMAKKLGLDWMLNGEHEPELNAIIDNTMKMLSQGKMDYCIFFRKLGSIHNSDTKNFLRNHTLDILGFDSWYDQYMKLVALDMRTLDERQSAMNKVNPKYILRNYLAQNAIAAAEQGDYSLVNALHEVLQNPFNEQPEFESYSDFPPQWGKELEISCSS